MEQRTSQLMSKINDAIKSVDKLTNAYEYSWYMSTQLTQDRYDLGTLHRLKIEKDFLLEILDDIMKLDTLEIIKGKSINFVLLAKSKSLKQYQDMCESITITNVFSKLTQEEYDLLKEVLK